MRAVHIVVRQYEMRDGSRRNFVMSPAFRAKRAAVEFAECQSMRMDLATGAEILKIKISYVVQTIPVRS